MNRILRILAVFTISVKRLFAQKGLALATLLGLFIASALAMSIPMYADGIYQRILTTEIDKTGSSRRPPFAFMFRHIGSWSGAVPIDELDAVDTYLSERVVDQIGLKSRLFVRYLKSDNMRLYPATGQSYTTVDKPLEWVSFGTINDLEEHIEILEGEFPPPAGAEETSVVPVLVSEEMATKTGMQVGEDYVAYTQFSEGGTTFTSQLPVRVSGIWRVNNREDQFWFYAPEEFATVLLLPESSLRSRILSQQGNSVYLALWYYLLDGSAVHSSEVPALLARINLARSRAINMLPTIRLDVSPEEALKSFQSSARSLTLFLFAFSVPILGMTLTFIALVVEMVVNQRRNEIAVLRSRGATVVQVAGMAALVSILIGLVGLALGVPGAMKIASTFSRAVSFLNFSGAEEIQSQVTLDALRYGLFAVGIGLIFMILPTLSAASHTVITYKQDRARQMRRPWWQVIYLDILLLIPTGYGIYLMRGDSASLPMDPFQNPLLFLIPALGIFAATLLILRMLPLVMSLLAWIASKTRSVGFLMASRYLARTTSGYSAPLILLILTLSLSTFTASLAQTLDRHTHDQVYYRTGADLSLIEMGESTQVGGMGGGPMSVSTAPATPEEEEGPKWLFLPVSEHLAIPGVQAAARVEKANFTVQFGQDSHTVDFIGVDRVDFSQAAFWRRDFAPVSLGGLMNELARTSEGVLVSRTLLDRGLRLGDNLRARIYQDGQEVLIDYIVVGYFDYFPSWYPSSNPLVVGNLDFYYESIGGENPYDVWLRLADGTDSDAVVLGATKIFGTVLGEISSSKRLFSEQTKPERQGFFGLLSVGFAALGILTALGFLLYAYFSFQRRFIELGMLRAIGLSANQLIVLLGSEMACLFLTGLAAGTGLGVWVSRYFIPQLQVGSDMAARVPPFLVEIDWGSVFQVYILFGVLFILAMVILTLLLMRMKIFQAIKLGETA